jgi:hypothetical protein
MDRESLAPLARKWPSEVVANRDASNSARIIVDIEIEVRAIVTGNRFDGCIPKVFSGPRLGPAMGIEHSEQSLGASFDAVEERDWIGPRHLRRN